MAPSVVVSTSILLSVKTFNAAMPVSHCLRRFSTLAGSGMVVSFGVAPWWAGSVETIRGRGTVYKLGVEPQRPSACSRSESLIHLCGKPRHSGHPTSDKNCEGRPTTGRKTELSGERGIRTLGSLAATPVFETGPINHSGISPRTYSAL